MSASLRRESRNGPPRSVRAFAPEALNDLVINPAYRSVLGARGLTTLAALFEAREAAVLGKPGLAAWRERLRLPPSADDSDSVMYLKRYRRPPRSAAWQTRRHGRGKRSVAGVEWDVLLALADAGIPSIEPIAYGVEWSGGRELRSAILTAAVPGEAMERLVETRPMDVRSARRDLITATARLVARLHRHGFVHRDLYLSHLFVELDARRSPDVYLIDVQRMFRPRRWRRHRWVVKDLAALHYSTPAQILSTVDRLRWLRAYLGEPKLGGLGRRLVRGVHAKSRRIARHDRRRRRRLSAVE